MLENIGNLFLIERGFFQVLFYLILILIKDIVSGLMFESYIHDEKVDLMEMLLRFEEG